MKQIGILVSILMLFGCETTPVGTPEPDNFQMVSCLNGEEFLITYVDKESVVIMTAVSELTFFKTASASGSKYLSEQGDMFWQKGSESILQLKGQAELKCKLQ
jgi:membrane-bound inhibitor of C-type lysozyme